MTDREILNRAINYVGIHYVNGVEDVYINPVLEKAIKAGAEALKEREERSKGCRCCWDASIDPELEGCHGRNPAGSQRYDQQPCSSNLQCCAVYLLLYHDRICDPCI